MEAAILPQALGSRLRQSDAATTRRQEHLLLSRVESAHGRPRISSYG